MAASILKTEAPAYTDIAGLSKLKRAAGNNDPAAIRIVAQQFESMFTRMMLKSMRDATGRDPMFGSDQEQMYQGMADDQLSVQLSKGKGLGLADMLVRQLQKMGVKGANEAGTTAAAGAKATAAYTSTQKASAATTTSSAATDATKTSFVQELWPHAQEAGQLLGVDPRHLLAQAALESNWGRNVPQDSAGRSSNNLFGIKASADWTGSTVTSGTQEFQGGAATNTSARFKAYATPAQSFQDYVALLRNNPRYSTALNTGGDLEAFATGLQRGGYATDPDYANKIAAVAGTLKLSSALPISANTGAL
ncbi:MAG TPA: flagellar assembly peptidoglycan hydrolase FlgJ [Steroidobacteraceae bacterium]|nr:flagellar assembly peptidoglycan hydrolase FlgJ [Steroidobacteraceae bacterium]